MKRKIIQIDENKCNGCGLCVPNCPEGAIQMIDGKARLVSDLLCDGLGACLGHCPQGAIQIEEREAAPYEEEKVMENMLSQGMNVVKAHLLHLKEHGQTEFLTQALRFLHKKGIAVPLNLIEKEGCDHGSHAHAGCPGAQMRDFAAEKKAVKKETAGHHAHSGCPGARMMEFSRESHTETTESGKRASHLQQWPVQLHLVSPHAPYFEEADILLSADCVAYTVGDFHKDYLQGKKLAIACPKLDSEQEIYREKITQMIDEAQIRSLTVMIMQVPCCMGLLRLVQAAAKEAKRKIPMKLFVVSLQGQILKEESF